MQDVALAEVVKALPDSVVVLDGEGRLVWANRAAQLLFGADDVSEFVGVSVFEFVHPGDFELAAVCLTSIHGKDVGTLVEVRVRTPAGWRLVEMKGSNYLDDPSIGGIILSLRDLTDRRRWEVASGSLNQFRSLVHNAASVVMLLDTAGTVMTSSAAITRILGHDQELVEGRPLLDLVVPSDVGEFEVALQRAVRQPESEATPTTVHVDLFRRDGTGQVPMELSFVNLLDDPTVRGIVVSGHDITQLRTAQDALADLAIRDTLTGLPNRALVLDRTEHLLARARRTNQPVSLLFVDLDGFKQVNDTLGHRIGDEILRAVGNRLSTALRESDTIGRLGGDEFVVLIDGTATSDNDAVPARAPAHDHDSSPVTVAQRILETLCEPFSVPSDARPRLQISASIGIVSGVYSSAEDLLRDADIALYEAKMAGKGRAVVFEPHMRATFERRFDLEKDLRTALETDQFELLYQPIVDLDTIKMVGAEALLRWRHPARGVLSPAEFIATLEETEMILAVGRIVLERACTQAKRWHDRGHRIRIAVNVSARQFEQDSLVVDIRGALANSGLDPETLVIEMTETALMHDQEGACRRLAELKDLGIRLAIDDFGTGYSSLAYLQQFPVDIIKIDRTFVTGMTASTEGAALVHALVQLGKALGLETLAEGIEHPDQLARLQTELCDSGQGFLIARPMHPLHLERLLDSGEGAALMELGASVSI